MAADIFDFVADQRGDRSVVRISDGESGLSARTIARRLSSISGFYAYLVARGDTAIGSNSDVIDVASDGTYLIRVLAEETQTPTPEQVKIFEDSGFSYWYTRQKEAATIDYPLSSTDATG